MNATTDASFSITRWKMVRLAGIDVFPTLKKEVFLQFDEATHKFQGHAGCNNMMGVFTNTNGKLKIGPVGMSRMFCEGPGMDVENIFARNLDKADNYQIRGDRMVLRIGNDFLAEFEAF